MGPHTRVTDPRAWQKALSLVDSDYQRGLLMGERPWSGAPLRGRKGASKRYAQKRQALLNRLSEMEIPWRFERVKSGRKILVIGDPPSRYDVLMAEGED